MDDRIGGFRSLGRVARGGSCDVYEVEVDRARAALKWLLADLSGNEYVRRGFLQEISLLQRARSARLPTVLARGESEGRPFVALAWLDAAPLVIERERSVRECAVIVRDVLDALDALHGLEDERGALSVVHRDVSALNVLVDREGRATLIDLGLASSRDFARPADALNEGTLGYHAPEMFTGAHPIDARADLFCGGVLLWELLARRPLFTRSKFAAAHEVTDESWSRPALPRDTDAALCAVVDRALSYRPDQRWPDAKEFSMALSRWTQ